MAFLNTIKEWFQKKNDKSKELLEDTKRVSVPIMEKRFEAEDLVGAAKDLRNLLEIYGRSKKKSHRYKGREFIYFILSNKHKDLKNIGYTHWQNINQIIQLNHKKVYPYHKNNLRKAMTFFETEIKGINAIDFEMN